MIKKNLFLRGFCMAAALTLAAGNIPVAGLQSFAAVSEAESVQEAEEMSEAEDTGLSSEAEAAEMEEQSDEAAAETGEQNQSANAGETGDVGEQKDDADEAADAEGTEVQAEAGNTESQTEETDETGSETAISSETGETNPNAEENGSQTVETGEQAADAGETGEEGDTAAEDSGEKEGEGQETVTPETGEAEKAEEESAASETKAGAESETTADPEAASESESEDSSASKNEDKEEKEETLETEEEIPAEGVVEGLEAELNPAVEKAELELVPQQLEAANILSDVTVGFEWPKAGDTVASARQKVNITHSDTFKTCTISYRTGSDKGPVLADNATFTAGTVYYVTFDIVLNKNYYIDSSTSVTVNDTVINMNVPAGKTWNQFNFYVYDTVEEGTKPQQETILKEIAATVTWPDPGDTIGDTKKLIKITNQDKFSSANINFRKTLNGQNLPDTATVEEGQLFVVFDITLKSGYFVDPTSKVTLNGEVIDLAIPAGKTWSTFYFYKDTSITVPDLTALKEFVERFYEKGFGRAGDPGGIQYWAKSLHKKTIDGTGLLLKFFESGEFRNLNVSDEEYVTRLYRVIFNREPEGSALDFWTGFLTDGMSRTYVLARLAGTREFKNLCDAYDIAQGRIKLTENRDQNQGISAFMARIYVKALDRPYDVSGMNFWTGEILKAANKKARISSAAQFFFLGSEFAKRGLSQEETLKTLYRVFMNREADTSGLNYWKGRLDAGMGMDKVIAYFGGSKEFKDLMSQYGIN